MRIQMQQLSVVGFIILGYMYFAKEPTRDQQVWVLPSQSTPNSTEPGLSEHMITKYYSNDSF